MKGDWPNPPSWLAGAGAFQYDFSDVVDAQSAKLFLLERVTVCLIHNTPQLGIRTTIPKPSLSLMSEGCISRESWSEAIPITVYMCPLCNAQAGIWGDKKLHKPHRMPPTFGRDRTGLVAGPYHHVNRALFR